MALYFRDLNNGPWISYNSISLFDGASLLKVPVMISYLKVSESYPEILKTKINYQEDVYKDEKYDPVFDKTLKIGHDYSIEYLIETMIQKSDNTANRLLRLAENELQFSPNIQETYKLLGLDNESNDIFIDEYAGIFRILYNAEYLNGETSNKALEIMTKTDYNNGLTKYLPSDIKVAHKYGIRFYDDDESYHLHDCGIIYTDNPYILCVMTLGYNLEQQEELVAKISKTSYEIFR
jgi:beta-lactamase class A